MDVALCTLDGQVYDAIQFEGLGPAQVEALRYDLVCTVCNGPGYFRKSSRSGHGPCFGARPHSPDCTLAATTEDPWGEAGDDVVQRMEADQTRIVLSLGQASAAATGQAGASQRAQGGRQFLGAGTSQRSEMQRNPDKLLRLLVASPRFRTSGLLLSPGSGPDLPVNEFFVAFRDATSQRHVDVYRGFWGKPHSIRQWNGLTYLNTGATRPTLSFWLPQETIEALVTKYRLGSISDLSTKYVLAIGTPELSTTGKFTLNVMNPRAVAVMDDPQS